MESMEVVLDVYGRPHKVLVPDLVKIGEDTINDDICKQPGHYAFYAAALADVRSRRDAAAQALKDKRAEEEIKFRKVADDCQIKTTEAKIAAQVELHPDVQKWKAHLLILEGGAGKLDAIVRSFEHRKEMLITLGANMRTDVEKGAAPSIRRKS